MLMLPGPTGGRFEAENRYDESTIFMGFMEMIDGVSYLIELESTWDSGLF